MKFEQPVADPRAGVHPRYPRSLTGTHDGFDARRPIAPFRRARNKSTAVRFSHWMKPSGGFGYAQRASVPSLSVVPECATSVMPGLVPGIHAAVQRSRWKWMPGTSPGMTRRRHESRVGAVGMTRAAAAAGGEQARPPGPALPAFAGTGKSGATSGEHAAAVTAGSRRRLSTTGPSDPPMEHRSSGPTDRGTIPAVRTAPYRRRTIRDAALRSWRRSAPGPRHGSV